MLLTAVHGVLYRAARAGGFILCYRLRLLLDPGMFGDRITLFREALGIRVCYTWVLCTYLHE